MELEWLWLIPIGVTLCFILVTAFIKPNYWRFIREAEKELEVERKSLENWRALLRGESAHGDCVEIVKRRLQEVGGEAKKNTRRRDFITLSIKAIYGSRNVEADLEAVISAMAQEEEKLLYSLRLAPNFMLLFGLLGTSVGLILTIVFWSDLFREGGQSIPSHAGGAFLATVIGVACSIRASWIVQNLGQKQNEMLAEAQHFILSEVAPKLLPGRPETVVADLRDVVEESRKLLERVPKVLSKAAEEFESSLTKAHEGLQSVCHDLNIVANSVSYSAQEVGEGVKAVRDGLQEVRQSTEELRKFHGELQEVYKGLDDQFTQSRKHLEEVARGSIEELHRATQRVTGEFGSQAENVLQAVREVFKETTNLCVSLNQASERLSENMARLAEIKDELRGGSEEILRGVSHYSEDILDRTKNLVDEYRERIVDLDRTLQRGLDRVGGAIQERMKELQGEFLQKVGDLDRTLQGGLHRVAERLEELAQRLDPRSFPVEKWMAMVEGLHAVGSLRESLPKLQDIPLQMQELSRVVEKLSNVLLGLERQIHGKWVLEAPQVDQQELVGGLKEIKRILEEIRDGLRPRPGGNKRKQRRGLRGLLSWLTRK